MPKLSANISPLYPETAFLGRFSAAAQDGFNAVEFQFAFGHAPEELLSAVQSACVEVVVLNCPAGDMEAGERGIAIFEERINECREAIDRAVLYARTLACKRIHLMAGILADEQRQAPGTVFRDNLRYAAECFNRPGEVVLVEALNNVDVPHYFVSNLAQAASIIESVDYSNVRLQFDFYHCQMTHGRLTENFDRYFPLVGHVQAAGVPGRHELNVGEINYQFIFDHIDAAGYAGYVGCEYHPMSTTREGIGSLKRCLDTPAG